MGDSHRVCATDELKTGEVKRVVVDGVPIAVFNLDGGYYALDDTCSHALASLSEGFIEEDWVECPKHGSQFHIPTGEVRHLPATRPVASHPVEVRDGEIWVGV